MRATWIQFGYSGTKDTTHNNSGHMYLKWLQILQTKTLFTLQFLFNIILIKFLMCYHKMNTCIICQPIIILHALARAVSRWLLTEEARIQFRASPCGYMVGKVALEQVLSEYFSFPKVLLYRCSILTCIHLPLMTYNLSNWQCHQIVHFSLPLIQSPCHCVYTLYQLYYLLYQNTKWYTH